MIEATEYYPNSALFETYQRNDEALWNHAVGVKSVHLKQLKPI
jgi:hypothetical protein